MTARAVVGEEVAVAVPRALVEADGMGVVLATEGRLELAELDAVRLLGILLGLRDFADHAGVHWPSLAFCLAPDVGGLELPEASGAGMRLRRCAIWPLVRQCASSEQRS